MSFDVMLEAMVQGFGDQISTMTLTELEAKLAELNADKALLDAQISAAKAEYARRISLATVRTTA